MPVNLTAGTKGSYFKLMAKLKSKSLMLTTINFVSSNALRLHDSLILENIDYPFPEYIEGLNLRLIFLFKRSRELP
jgi:hypothetical protein